MLNILQKTFSKSSFYHCFSNCFHQGRHLSFLDVGLSNITGLSAGRVWSLLSTSFTSLSESDSLSDFNMSQSTFQFKRYCYIVSILPRQRERKQQRTVVEQDN